MKLKELLDCINLNETSMPKTVHVNQKDKMNESGWKWTKPKKEDEEKGEEESDARQWVPTNPPFNRNVTHVQALGENRFYIVVDSMPEWVAVTEAADFCGVSRQAIHKAIKRGELRAKVLGDTSKLVNTTDLLAYNQKSHKGGRPAGSKNKTPQVEQPSLDEGVSDPSGSQADEG